MRIESAIGPHDHRLPVRRCGRRDDCHDRLPRHAVVHRDTSRSKRPCARRSRMRRTESRWRQFRRDFDLKASADYVESVRGTDVDLSREGTALVATADLDHDAPADRQCEPAARISRLGDQVEVTLSTVRRSRRQARSRVSAARSCLRQALTHRSFAADHNERLEFIGDGVLNCAIALLLYRALPRAPRGRSVAGRVPTW